MSDLNSDSIVVIRQFRGESGVALYRSEAVLHVLSKLSWPCGMLAILKVFPRFVADPCYDFVARRRYRWFGMTNECHMVDDKDKWRVIE